MKQFYERLSPQLTFQSVPMDVLLQKYASNGFGRGVNLGSKSVRLGPQWTNVDLVKGPEVDVVADIHDLSMFTDASFDAAVLSAVLQYCRNPFQVVAETARVLRPGGIVIVNVPFLQPVCPEGAAFDRFRFTHVGLIGMFEDTFHILESGTAIGSGSVFATTVRSIADHATKNRYLSAMMRLVAGWASAPIARTLRNGHPDNAGAIYLVGERRG